MNWELFGIVLVWLAAVYSTVSTVVTTVYMVKYNSHLLVESGLKRKLHMNGIGLFTMCTMIVSISFLAVYYFG